MTICILFHYYKSLVGQAGMGLLNLFYRQKNWRPREVPDLDIVTQLTLIFLEGVDRNPFQLDQESWGVWAAGSADWEVWQRERGEGS